MRHRPPTFFALIALGIVLLLVGFIYGLGSRHASYKSVAQGTIVHYLSSEGTGYLQMEGNTSLFVVHEDNFSPKISSFADGDIVSLVYDPSETTAIDVSSVLGTHLKGTASKVVEITFSDAKGQKLYVTPEYMSDPQGYDHNQWGVGIGLMLVGLLFTGGAFFLPKKKIQEVTSTPVSENTSSEVPEVPQLPFPPRYSPTQSGYQPEPGTFQQTPYNGGPQ